MPFPSQPQQWVSTGTHPDDEGFTEAQASGGSFQPVPTIPAPTPQTSSAAGGGRRGTWKGWEEIKEGSNVLTPILGGLFGGRRRPTAPQPVPAPRPGVDPMLILLGGAVAVAVVIAVTKKK